jgi:cytochrome c biogenesis protein CcdA
MGDFLIVAASALWFGVLTSVSPCPLATNVAAISFVARRVSNPRLVLAAGLLYTVGRMLVYTALGALLVYGVFSIPHASGFLQKYMNKVLGPVLVLTGMLLLGLLGGGWSGPGAHPGVRNRAERMGVWGAGLLGAVFALSFCPVSAALFFGSLVPLAIRENSVVLVPAVYGLGTALPVVIFAFIVAFSAHSLGMVFDRITVVEKWARRITGSVFIVVGIYLSLVYIFNIL